METNEKSSDWHCDVYKPPDEDLFYLSTRWRKLSEKVKNRDEWKCRACGVSAGLTVHHRKPREQGGRDTMKNLITLCVKCHDRAELGEDIFQANCTQREISEDWHSWVYGGGREPSVYAGV